MDRCDDVKALAAQLAEARRQLAVQKECTDAWATGFRFRGERMDVLAAEVAHLRDQGRRQHAALTILWRAIDPGEGLTVGEVTRLRWDVASALAAPTEAPVPCGCNPCAAAEAAGRKPDHAVCEGAAPTGDGR